MTHEPELDSNPDLDPADDLDTPEPDAALTDDHDRVDYVAVDGRTRVSVFTFADGSALKVWSDDGGERYTARDIDIDGKARLARTTYGLTPDHVNALAAAHAEAIEARA